MGFCAKEGDSQDTISYRAFIGGCVTKSVVTIIGSDGEQPQSAAAKVEGLA